MQRLPAVWNSMSTLQSKQFECGHCGSNVTSNLGYYATTNTRLDVAWAYLCHFCNRLTSFDAVIEQVPAPMLGRAIAKLPDDVATLYDEARKASAVGAYSLVLLGGRKLLMHIAVSLGAREGLKFVQYVQFLEENHFTPPRSAAWVRSIKDLGNESNHEVKIASKNEAETILKFSDLLMTFNYEFADDEPEVSEAPEKTE